MPTQARRKAPTRQQLQTAVMLLGVVYSDQVETVAALLARGADPNIRVEVNAQKQRHYYATTIINITTVVYQY